MQNDFQTLTDHCQGMAEMLLIEQGEFYPFAVYLDNGGKLIPADFHYGDDFPLSQTLICNFKSYFDPQISNSKIKAYAIAFDTKVTNDVFPKSINSLAIRIVHIDSENIVTYYFPYMLSGRRIEFLKGWEEYSN